MRRCSSIHARPRRRIADGIYRVLTDETLRRDLRKKGVARAGMFSWETSVRRVHKIYMQAAQQ